MELLQVCIWIKCIHCTLGTHIEIVTDHTPLVPIYKNIFKPKQLHVNNHKNKLLSFQYNVIHQPGRLTPCDYGSQYPLVQEFTQTEVESWCIEDGSDILVNRLLEDNMPKAVTLKILRKETSSDEDDGVLYIYCLWEPM